MKIIHVLCGNTAALIQFFSGFRKINDAIAEIDLILKREYN